MEELKTQKRHSEINWPLRILESSILYRVTDDFTQEKWPENDKRRKMKPKLTNLSNIVDVIAKTWSDKNKHPLTFIRTNVCECNLWRDI